MNLSTNEAELQSLLSTLNGINGMVNVTSVSPQNLTEQLMNATSDAAITSIVNSISSLQGINSSQLAYLQSLSTATSTSALNQSLINLGSQNQDFLTSVLSNASGSISADQLQQLLQQFNASSSAECSQISQQIAGLNSLAQQGSSSGASDVLGLSAIAQYIPTQSCSGL